MVKAEIEMLKKSLFSLKLFWEQDDECLHTGTKLKKITKKVEFNIASEASNVNILSGQKFIKNGPLLVCTVDLVEVCVIENVTSECK